MVIIIKGGVTTPKGFIANGVKARIKRSGRKDLALLYSEVPAVVAGAFTTNVFQASPVKISRGYLKNDTHQAIIVNSGNANCANGRPGDRDAALMAGFIAKTMGLDTKEVLVASTGIIGMKLPIKNIENAVPALIGGLSEVNGTVFAETIKTTDTFTKEFAVKLKMGAHTVTIGGACKGVGMLYPEMKTERHATMLSFITTDACISKAMLESALDEAVAGSFNMISVDGDMSTNDSCFLMANGLAGNDKIRRKSGHYAEFIKALKFLASELARMLVRDGEGATKFVEIEVAGARTAADAAKIARKITTSNLLKCCIYGEDPNWGRVVAACGSAGVKFDPNRADVYIGTIKALSNGAIDKTYNKDKARQVFKCEDIRIKVDLKSGRYAATAWTCDFSKEYVAINSEYST